MVLMVIKIPPSLPIVIFLILLMLTAYVILYSIALKYKLALKKVLELKDKNRMKNLPPPQSVDIICLSQTIVENRYIYRVNGYMNQLTQMDEGGIITTFQHDNNGNLIQKSDGTDTWEYIYDDGCSCNNRLTEIKLNGQTLGRYFYDGDGKRIKKIEDGMTTIYIYSGIKVIYEKVIETGVETKYIGSLAKIFKLP